MDTDLVGTSGIQLKCDKRPVLTGKKSMIMSNCCLIFPDNADECKERSAAVSFSDDSPGPASAVNLRYARHQAYPQASIGYSGKILLVNFAWRFYRLKP